MGTPRRRRQADASAPTAYIAPSGAHFAPTAHRRRRPLRSDGAPLRPTYAPTLSVGAPSPLDDRGAGRDADDGSAHQMPTPAPRNCRRRADARAVHARRPRRHLCPRPRRRPPTIRRRCPRRAAHAPPTPCRRPRRRPCRPAPSPAPSPMPTTARRRRPCPRRRAPCRAVARAVGRAAARADAGADAGADAQADGGADADADVRPLPKFRAGLGRDGPQLRRLVVPAVRRGRGLRGRDRLQPRDHVPRGLVRVLPVAHADDGPADDAVALAHADAGADDHPDPATVVHADAGSDADADDVASDAAPDARADAHADRRSQSTSTASAASRTERSRRRRSTRRSTSRPSTTSSRTRPSRRGPSAPTGPRASRSRPR